MKTYEDKIKETIDSICDEHKLAKPITVPSAGKMIAEHRGIDVAIELFEGAANETKYNIFRSSAFESTLETILMPEKTGIPFVFNFNKTRNE
jgi:hypothetical protein